MYRALFLFGFLASLLVSCGTFNVEGALLEKAAATATARAYEAYLASLPTPTPQPASIRGRVWHDLCYTPLMGGDSAASTAPVGDCVSEGWYRIEADGIFQPEEQGIEGVVVSLGRGSCPTVSSTSTATTSTGMFAFEGLAPGTYCVFVDTQLSTNQAVLLPGGWTMPEEAQEEQTGITGITVTVTAGEEKMDLAFGWDYQFTLPPPKASVILTSTVQKRLEDSLVIEPTDGFTSVSLKGAHIFRADGLWGSTEDIQPGMRVEVEGVKSDTQSGRLEAVRIVLQEE